MGYAITLQPLNVFLVHSKAINGRVHHRCWVNNITKDGSKVQGKLNKIFSQLRLTYNHTFYKQNILVTFSSFGTTWFKQIDVFKDTRFKEITFIKIIFSCYFRICKDVIIPITSQHFSKHNNIFGCGNMIWRSMQKCIQHI